MGLEARCQGRCGAEAGDGRLQFEGDRILFRGAFQLNIPAKDLKKVSAAGDRLEVSWGGRKASFVLGAAMAARWAHKILNPPSLLDKLGVKSGQRVGVKGAFDQAFLADLAARVKPSAVHAGEQYDIVLLLAQTPAELDDVGALAHRLAQAGALWIVYPKGGKPIREAEVRRVALDSNLVDNKTCAFSPTLTALRWVRPLALRVTSSSYGSPPASVNRRRA
jgi:hypothetical protein